MSLIRQVLVVGTRGSPLALIQTRFVISLIASVFSGKIKEQIIKTSGDKILNVPLFDAAKTLEKGLFVKELEEALLKGEIDLAVHSLKDLPVFQPAELLVAAIPVRENPWDCLITRESYTIDTLPPGNIIGSSSIRRIAQLRHYRSDLIFKDMRGNIGTRLEKLKRRECDAIVLARAGLNRMGLNSIELKGTSWDLPGNVMLHACGQGALAVECRKGEPLAEWLAHHLDDKETRTCVTAEREILAYISRFYEKSSCQIPIGAHASIETNPTNHINLKEIEAIEEIETIKKEKKLILDGAIVSIDGKTLVKHRESRVITEIGAVKEAKEIGEILAKKLADCLKF